MRPQLQVFVRNSVALPLLTLVGVALLAACSDPPMVARPPDGDGGELATGGRYSNTGGTPSIGVGGDTGTGGTPSVEAVCGNGELEAGEICDDGGTDDDDGCSADCKEQDPDYDCSEPGKPCVDTVVCGNGVLEGNEVCDEGEGNKTDGCEVGCDAIANGWSCPRPGRSCVALPACGNGIRERGEECDDNNDASLDGCSSSCALEDGYHCVPGQDCVLLDCGDGNRTPDEVCDDGNEADGDGCSSSCEVEEGFVCTSTGCRPVCGDGLVRGNATRTEECDDGGNASGDGCSSGCLVEPYYACNTSEPSVCATTIECGNGLVEPGEVCEPDVNHTNGCYATCDGFDISNIDPAVCGNHTLEFGEECDGGSGCDECSLLDGYACPAADYCFLLPVCGNGALELGEECDDGDTDDTNGCSNLCTVNSGYHCVPGIGCVALVCGDGNRTPDEECDDGDTDSGDGCSSLCEIEEGFRCSTNGCRPICGDGLVRSTEACDDNNRTSGDGCSSGCAVEPYFSCDDSEPTVCESTIECGNGEVEPGEICDPGLTGDNGCYMVPHPDACNGFDNSVTDPAVCGNGIVEYGEECDLGVGCHATDCTVLDGYVCPAADYCYQLPVCGNGTQELGEECDDGDSVDDNGCTNLCVVQDGYYCAPSQACVPLDCGDGNRTPNEECDDGNSGGGDGCSALCEIEEGFRCSASGCQSICGDGLVRAAEECDDGDLDSGDGCSSGCIEEPFWQCDNAEPSVCTTTIACGNGTLEPGELCEPDGSNGCYEPPHPEACQGFDNTVTDPAVCGNNSIEYGEECDGGIGCTNCILDDGYVCPTADYCYALPVCGDGIVQAGEQCDVGAVSSLPCENCIVQDDWYCAGSPSVCVESVCGDGSLAPDEQCDDANATSGDGCDTCVIEEGWVCPAGLECQPICGDGELNGSEECEFAGDGCTNCFVDVGYDCGVDGTNCQLTTCGNTLQEAGEGCDDGNTIAGDGCGPTCQVEPNIIVGSSPQVELECGDGLVAGSEQCDDGNTESGDGCSYPNCQVESGWYCEDVVTYPDALEIKVVHRDFMGRNVAGGHPHMRGGGVPSTGEDNGITGAVCNTYNFASCGRLDAEGKPILDEDGNHQTINPNGINPNYDPAAFRLWYRDTNTTVLDAAGTTLVGIDASPDPMPAVGFDTILLDRIGNTSAYEFERSTNIFYPLDGRGYGTTPGESHNFHFTTELRYFFQYQGGETLTFFGDDDVWVFVNGRLAVDIGGIHQTRFGRVILGDDGADGDATDSDCTIGNTSSLPTCDLEPEESDPSDTTDERFNLTVGNVYEIVLFQAERNPTESNFRLTLDGFIAPRSFCKTHCGDEIIAGNELCDEGALGALPNANPDASDVNVDGVYGACATNCTFSFCGDGVVEAGEEDCDNGANIDTWVGVLTPTSCAPGCVPPGYCGDGILQSANEVCDDGDGNNTGEYGACNPDCLGLGGYCGDGVVTEPEETCDTPGEFVLYGDGTQCGYDCEIAPHCGDGIRNGDEHCDGDANCNANCEYDPYCGDGLLASNEDCDYGSFGYPGDPEDAPYGGCTTACLFGPYCGDGLLHDLEECDAGDLASDTEYGGCTTNCTYGPRCGDGITQTIHGEACDNGYNEDTYAYVSDACGPNCTPVPYCGDGVLNGPEICDDGAGNTGAYGACLPDCTGLGGYCGDGVVTEPQEECDTPGQFVTYGDGTQCGYDCQFAPHCGDGVRNGNEECDGGPHCGADCTYDPYCGDGLLAASEACDYGAFGYEGEPQDAPYDGCTTECELGPYCGDGFVYPGVEECDEGVNNANGVYGGCNEDCTFGPRCGDAVQQSGEDCDNGINDDTYAYTSDACGPNCVAVPRCGDGTVQPAFEFCDDGDANNTGEYGACKPDCSGPGGYCGDGVVTEPQEECDTPGQFVTYGDGTQCGYDCKFAPHCGDGIRNGDEECDGGDLCVNCQVVPGCGDGVKSDSEACDYGAFAFDGPASEAPYGGCTTSCEFGPYCGDGTTHELEECDDGADNADDVYDACQTNCTLGPRCGDGITQSVEGEACDNGYNDDTYAFFSNACGPDCTPVPYCGDGTVDDGFELCDDGDDNDDSAYDGCTTACEWGPYCGDGVVQGDHEECDQGTENAAYSPDGTGCGYDCQPAPYCGDGIRNGPEACDDGTENNTGEHNGCNEDCTRAPYCGDGIVQKDAGEDCDDGPTGSLSCHANCTFRDIQ